MIKYLYGYFRAVPALRGLAALARCGRPIGIYGLWYYRQFKKFLANTNILYWCMVENVTYKYKLLLNVTGLLLVCYSKFRYELKLRSYTFY